MLAFIVAFLAGLIVGNQDVLASEKLWRGTVNDVNIIAYKSVNLGGYVWTTTLSSDAAQDINIIGYTYWTVGELGKHNGGRENFLPPLCFLLLVAQAALIGFHRLHVEGVEELRVYQRG